MSYSQHITPQRSPVAVSHVVQYGTQTFTASDHVLTSTNSDRYRVLRRCALGGISATIDVVPASATVKLVAMNGTTALGTLAITGTAGQCQSTQITEATLAAGDTLSFNVIATGTASAAQVNGSYTVWAELRELFA